MNGEPNSTTKGLNLVISGWICIALGAGVVLSDSSAFSLGLAAPISIAGIIFLLLGISVRPPPIEKNENYDIWSPPASIMPDAGRPMYRIDTTLEPPIKTSILCGKCANIELIEGGKPKRFTCQSCGTLLWSSEEE